MRPEHDAFDEQSLERPYDPGLLGRLLPFVRPYRGPLALAVVLIVAITGLDLVLPYVTKEAIDRYIVPPQSSAAPDGPRMLQVDLEEPRVRAVVARFPALFQAEGSAARIAYPDLRHLPPEDLRTVRRADLAGLGGLALLFLLLIGADFTLNFCQRLTMEKTGLLVMHDLRLALFQRLQSLSLPYFTRHPVGRLVTRVTNDIQNMHELFTSVIALFFKDLFLLAGILAVMLAMSWRLALAVLLVVPLVVYTARYFARHVREVFRSLRIKVAEINTRFAETIGGISVLQVFRQEGANLERFRRLNHDNYLMGMREIHLLAVFMPLIEMLGVITVAVIIYYGGLRSLAGDITIGTLVAFISYIKMFFRPIRDLAEKYNILQNALASAERIFQIMDSRETTPRPRHPLPALPAPDPATPAVAFEGVRFGYTPEAPVVRDISFTAGVGETVALVGPTGSGKTSLVSLLLRFYRPDAGTIRVFGADLADLPPEVLRSRLAVVMQEPFLFSGTVRDNIFPPEDAVSREREAAVLEAANCQDLVGRLPRGLDTLLTEGGATLSSGERQLLCIARAFARDPAIILLDEATSYIDSATEARVQEALARLMAGRTALVVAHRLSTVRQAHRILVLRKGRIVESGRHEELMARRGFYHRLHQLPG
jgi:ATP-binding cassette subfamily B protein